MSKLSKTEIADLDKWIEQLKECQPLEECQVKILCEKVKNKYIIYIKIINLNLINIGKRNLKTRAKCPACKSPCNSLWGYPRPIF